MSKPMKISSAAEAAERPETVTFYEALRFSVADRGKQQQYDIVEEDIALMNRDKAAQKKFAEVALQEEGQSVTGSTPISGRAAVASYEAGMKVAAEVIQAYIANGYEPSGEVSSYQKDIQEALARGDPAETATEMARLNRMIIQLRSAAQPK